MVDLRERIELRLKELGLNAFEAARSAGLERSYIHDILTGRKVSVREANIVKLSKALSVDPAFFFQDATEKHSTKDKPTHSNRQINEELGAGGSRLFQGSQPGSIPELDIIAGAGEGTVGEIVILKSNGIEYGHAVKAEWILPSEFVRYYLGADPRQIWIIEVKGHSMEPTLEPGAKVFVDLRDRKPDEQSVYLIDDDGPKVKRLMKIRGSDPEMYRILSDNKLVPDDIIRAEDLRVIGRICGRITKM